MTFLSSLSAFGTFLVALLAFEVCFDYFKATISGIFMSAVGSSLLCFNGFLAAAPLRLFEYSDELSWLYISRIRLLIFGDPYKCSFLNIELAADI